MENACQYNNAKVQQCNETVQIKYPKMVQREECSLNNKYLKFGTED